MGRFIAVVGPSGVGKDSVMEALAASDDRYVLARRVISRPSTAGGEDFEGVTEAEFHARAERGDFALHWSAHGLYYGIPNKVDEVLDEGHDVLANLSRAVLPQMQKRFAKTEVILLMAPSKVLAKRLSARGRETAEDIAKRLDRAGFALPEGVTAHEVSNNRPLPQTVSALQALLEPESVARCS
ncbi:MAG: phosphonate metabolism protein/1,5-bisphosphokinase (PRPP-forming) PhnN [Pseudomonadota bacterium]